jgi:hypothetical protein
MPRRKVLVVSAATVAVLAVAGAAYYELLREGFVHYGKYDRRDRGSLKVGAQAPDLDLTMYDGTPLRLSQLWDGPQPVFVVFGSCT